MSIPLSLLAILIGVYIVLRTIVISLRTIQARSNIPIISTIEPEDVSKTSLIVPVLFEEPKILEKALQSWIKNSPGEIIMVVDQRDPQSAELVRSYQLRHANIHLIIEPKAGKRSALLSGFLHSKGRYVILVDSDVYWMENTMKNLLMPLKSPLHHIGGVSGIQDIQTHSLASLLFSYQQCVRLQIQMCQRAAAKHQRVPNLLGRTAAYRREALENALPALVQAKCGGQRNTGGDDVFLANFIQSSGWQAYEQPTAQYSTAPAKDMYTFLQQTIRWSRGATREASKMIQKPEIGLFATLRTYVLGIIDVANIVILPCVTIFALIGMYFPALAILVMSILGTLVPLLLLKNSAFTKHVFAIYLYEHFVGLLRIYGISTAMKQAWLTR